jgi:hypothetical protein
MNRKVKRVKRRDGFSKEKNNFFNVKEDIKPIPKLVG